ncbi:MAG: hypothetical protein H7296_06810 [Bacteroidia bacterium]|nr:hypothetical protein [Bacteroidia bacterium]
MKKTPDAVATQDVATPKKKQTKSNISTNEAGLFVQAYSACGVWKRYPELTIKWTTQAKFEIMLEGSEINFNARLSMGGKRKSITQKLNQADSEMDKAIAALKVYLAKKYKSETNAIPHYSKFGIALQNNAYLLPRDRNRKAAALLLTIEAIKSEGFSEEEYGEVYWLAQEKLYKELLKEATILDGNVSEKVGNKKMDVLAIKKILNALIFMLKANYPDTFDTELRHWGFQKEKY